MSLMKWLRRDKEFVGPGMHLYHATQLIRICGGQCRVGSAKTTLRVIVVLRQRFPWPARSRGNENSKMTLRLWTMKQSPQSSKQFTMCGVFLQLATLIQTGILIRY
jgi:hypothetical protein